MSVNKVEINGEVKLDLTQDTVTEDTLLQGVTAHDAAGNTIEGKVVTTPVPKTSDLLKGDGKGGVSAAKAGTDYATPEQVAAKQDVLLASGASVGDLIKVKAVDASGKPTAWEVAAAGKDYLKTAPVTSVNGKTGAVKVREVPSVTASDNGKFLRVTNGAWAAVEIANANGGSF